MLLINNFKQENISCKMEENKSFRNEYEWINFNVYIKFSNGK